MPLESGTYIPDLVAANPAHTDGVSQGDSHLRLVKSVLLNTFPNWTDNSGLAGVGFLTSTQAQLDNAVKTVIGTGNNAIFPAGTVGSPGIQFTGDPDSGFFKAGEDNIALSLNAATQVNFTTALASFAPSISAPTITTTNPGTNNYNSGFFVVPGVIAMWSGTTAPTGWAFCNGGTVSAAANPALNVIYGNSGGNITLPDMRDMVAIGKGDMGGVADRGAYANSGVTAGILTLGSVIGEGTHVLSTGELPAHQHNVYLKDPGHLHAVNCGAQSQFVFASGTQAGIAASFTGSSFTGMTIGSVNGVANDNLTASTGSGTGHNIVQYSFVLGFIIKLG
jgi:microcystin-dependent protein